MIPYAKVSIDPKDPPNIIRRVCPVCSLHIVERVSLQGDGEQVTNAYAEHYQTCHATTTEVQP